MNAEITVPVENITRQYLRIQDEVQAAIAEVLPTGKYVLGPQLRAFEEEFAAFCQTKYCLGISSGTEAPHLALIAWGIGLTGSSPCPIPTSLRYSPFSTSERRRSLWTWTRSPST